MHFFFLRLIKTFINASTEYNHPVKTRTHPHGLQQIKGLLQPSKIVQQAEYNRKKNCIQKKKNFHAMDAAS
jgi:hypothetical protein